eukprot:9318991-Pyramimonas_sp.AAC.2
MRATRLCVDPPERDCHLVFAGALHQRGELDEAHHGAERVHRGGAVLDGGHALSVADAGRAHGGGEGLLPQRRRDPHGEGDGAHGRQTLLQVRRPIARGQVGYSRVANQSREGRSDIPSVRTNHMRGGRIFPRCEPIT